MVLPPVHRPSRIHGCTYSAALQRRLVKGRNQSKRQAKGTLWRGGKILFANRNMVHGPSPDVQS
jgi:hypothetical protein